MIGRDQKGWSDNAFISLYLLINLAPPCNPACQRGGTCVNGQCLCPQGYAGSHCQIFGK